MLSPLAAALATTPVAATAVATTTTTVATPAVATTARFGSICSHKRTVKATV
jgi:hypothetical protein